MNFALKMIDWRHSRAEMSRLDIRGHGTPAAVQWAVRTVRPKKDDFCCKNVGIVVEKRWISSEK